MISLILVMSVILGAVNLLNSRQVVLDADRTLAFLAENDGEFPRKGKDFDIGDNPKYMSPELARVSRYFCIELDSDEELYDLDISEIAGIDEKTAYAYAQEVLELGKTSGFLSHYRYLVQSLSDDDDSPAIRILFLDCWRSLSNVDSFFLACVWTALCGILAVRFLRTTRNNAVSSPMPVTRSRPRLQSSRLTPRFLRWTSGRTMNGLRTFVSRPNDSQA